jgi:hypothetical protein
MIVPLLPSRNGLLSPDLSLPIAPSLFLNAVTVMQQWLAHWATTTTTSEGTRTATRNGVGVGEMETRMAAPELTLGEKRLPIFWVSCKTLSPNEWRYEEVVIFTPTIFPRSSFCDQST